MLRVRVELVRGGNQNDVEVLDEILIANDGTGIPGGTDEGGVGNYAIWDQMTIDQLHAMDYPYSAKVGELKGIPRSPEHRLEVARRSLQIVEMRRKAEKPA